MRKGGAGSSVLWPDLMNTHPHWGSPKQVKDWSFLSPFHLLLRAGAPASKGKEKGAG